MNTFSSTASWPAVGDSGVIDIPLTIVVNGGAPHLNGASHMQAAPPPAGHNSAATPFDAIVKENLRRGLYLSQRDALIAVARDPRCTRSHILAHAIVVYFMNSATGMAFPGWRAIAEMMSRFPGEVSDPGGAYSESTVNNLLSDLRRWGYLPSAKRGPEGGGRAIAHYTVARPSHEQLREEITKFILESRALDEKARKRIATIGAGGADLPPPQEVSDLLTPKEVRAASDLLRGEDVSSDLLRGRAADLLRGRVTVTSKEEPEEEMGADAPGLPFDDQGQRERPKRTSAKSGGLTDREIDAHFDEWYAAYPKKKAPLDARKAYASAVKAKGATPTQLLAAVKLYKFPTDKQYIPYPATWLNRGSWLEVSQAADAENSAAPNMPPFWWQRKRAAELLPTDVWRQLINAHGNPWSEEMLGPPPGTSGSVVPADVVQKLGLANGGAR